MPTVNGKFVAETRDDADLRRAEIVAKGKKAQREIGSARIAAQKAWQEWRMHGTFRAPDGQINQKPEYAAQYILTTKPGVRLPNGDVEPGVPYQQLTGFEHPELKELKEKAEAADRHVLELQDDLDIFTALVPSVMRKA